MTKTMLLSIEGRLPNLKKIAKFILLFISFAILSKAQNATIGTDQIKIESDSILNLITIDFNVQDIVANLLVYLVDSDGHTVFLDNKYNFSGIYKKSIDMKNQGKGFYLIEVSEDSKHFSRKIEFR